jgi:hypothetical protein
MAPFWNFELEKVISNPQHGAKLLLNKHVVVG